MKAKQVMKRHANKISVPLKVMKKPIAMKTTLKKPATEVAAPAHKDFKDEVQCVGPSGRVLCTRMVKLGGLVANAGVQTMKSALHQESRLYLKFLNLFEFCHEPDCWCIQCIDTKQELEEWKQDS